MINQKSWILFLLCFSLVAVFTSQTAVDLSDISVVLSALFLSFKEKQWKSFFCNFKPVWIWPVWVFILFLGMIINVGFNDIKAWSDFFEFRWIITFLSIIYLGSKIELDTHFIRMWSWVLLLLNIVALTMFVQDPYWRVQGILKTTMAFSHNIAPLFSLLIIYCLSRWNDFDFKSKVLFFAVTFSSALLTLLTFTRGVWIGSLVGILIAAMWWNKKKALILLSVGVITTIILLATNQRVYNRVFGKTVNETQSNNERIALWRGNWAMIRDYPIFGVGVGQNKKHLRKYYDEMGYPQGQRESHAHNQYLQLWAGAGVFGVGLFLLFNFLILRKACMGLSRSKETSRSIQLGLLAAVLCFMIGGVTESNFNIAKNRFLFLILAGLAVSQSIRLEKNSKL